MVRITKLTDYALVVLAYIARKNDHLVQAREIAFETHLSVPTVSKLLKKLTKCNFLHSQRGIQGGYQLKADPKAITVLELITALEGPLAMTECSLGQQQCPTENNCALRTPWLHINHVISEALASIKLADLIHPELSNIKFNAKLSEQNRENRENREISSTAQDKARNLQKMIHPKISLGVFHVN